MRIVRLAALSLAAVALFGCDDDGIAKLKGPPDVGGVFRCVDDNECGPREECTATGICVSIDDCDDMHPCPGSQICMDFNGDGRMTCGSPPCMDASDCTTLSCANGEIAQCVNDRCICGSPCQGGCPGGKGCCIPEDRCYDLPAMCAGLTCPAGQFVSVTSTGAWDTGQCSVLGEVCECVRLPPLPEGDIGLHSAISHDGRTAVMTAYNLDYGDLMYGVLQSDGISIDWDFVDGVPTTTAAEDIAGDVDGPRGGVRIEGDDVGLYTDVKVDLSGRPHIVYHDRTNGALKYAIGLATGWSIHTIDPDGAAGLYADIALTTDGKARVAYLAARHDNNNTRYSTLRLATTNALEPSRASDWTIRDLDALSLATFGCEEQCNPDEVCRASDLMCVKPDPAGSCTGGCQDAGTRCIGGRCVLIDPLPPFRDLPMARGLFPSVQIQPDGAAVVAYYDRIDRNLKIATVAGPNPGVGRVDVMRIDGMGTGSTDDVGQFPSLFITPGGETHIAYVNTSRRALVYRNLDAQFMTLIEEVVETGIGQGNTPSGDLIGADPALVVDGQGIVRIAYQNATTGELRYARRMGDGTWTLVTLRGNEAPYAGTFGFYTDQTLDSTRLAPLVSTYRYWLAQPNGNGLVVVTPP